MLRRHAAWVALLALLAARPARPADGPDKEQQAADEKTLKEARVTTDGAGLLAYFKARVPDADTLKKLSARIKQLGDEVFKVREQA
jgi:hypothetical protein